ncbi:MAG TPA: flagellar hook-associated protein FlgK [Alphaproteobacteria bacterium]|jgi:flagellar hook-associated protein 1 FlgK
MSSSINVALGTAISGLQTTQAALGITSNNIANANTPGYTRKNANLQNVLIDGQGAGVKIGSVTRQVNEYLLRDMRAQTTLQGETGVRQQFFSSMQNLFGTPDSGSSIASTLTTLGNKMTALAVDPSSSNSQLDMVGAAQTLTRQLNDMSGQIQDMRYQADQNVADSVDQINQTLQNIAELNVSISRSIALNQPAGDLQDQRDTAVASLASQMDISYFTRDSGEMVIFMASGQPLVDREASTISYTPAATMGGDVSYPGGGLEGIKLNGTDITDTIKSGKLRGLIDMRDTELPNFASEMNTLARTLKDQLNAIHNDGVAIPPPASLTGSTGFADPATDTVSLTGTVRIAVLNSDGSAAGPAFDLNLDDLATVVGGDPTVNQIRDAINGVYATATPPIAGLAGATASVGAHGELTIAANAAGQGIGINEGTSKEAASGFGFSHYFGLNDLIVGGESGGLAGNVAVRGDILLDSQKVARGQLSEGTLAAGDSAITVGDGSVAQRMADVFNARLTFSAAGGLPTTSTTLSGYGASILSDNATRSANADDADSYRQNLLDDTSSKAQSASGVNTDEEMANLIMYQNAYGASARVITTLSDMLKTLTDMV